MAQPFLGEIRMVSFNYAPSGWALCNGQVLPINQNQALFSLLGTTYGGNGVQTFQLPNYQGRMPMHFGNGYNQGQSSGEPTHTLLVTEMPSHNHSAVGVTSNASSAAASGALFENFILLICNLYSAFQTTATGTYREYVVNSRQGDNETDHDNYLSGEGLVRRKEGGGSQYHQARVSQ